MSLRLHCTSIGKAVLATMPDDEVRALLARTGLPARTAHTITDVDALIAELADVRGRGFAEDHEENEAGVRAVGAAVFDHTGQVFGAVSAAALVYRDDPAGDRGDQVVQAAAEVSRALGAH
jgi:DNA-binding IclR family transcriptional regulator